MKPMFFGLFIILFTFLQACNTDQQITGLQKISSVKLNEDTHLFRVPWYITPVHDSLAWVGEWEGNYIGLYNQHGDVVRSFKLTTIPAQNLLKLIGETYRNDTVVMFVDSALLQAIPFARPKFLLYGITKSADNQQLVVAFYLTTFLKNSGQYLAEIIPFIGRFDSTGKLLAVQFIPPVENLHETWMPDLQSGYTILNDTLIVRNSTPNYNQHTPTLLYYVQRDNKLQFSHASLPVKHLKAYADEPDKAAYAYCHLQQLSGGDMALFRQSIVRLDNSDNVVSQSDLDSSVYFYAASTHPQKADYMVYFRHKKGEKVSRPYYIRPLSVAMGAEFRIGPDSTEQIMHITAHKEHLWLTKKTKDAIFLEKYLVK